MKADEKTVIHKIKAESKKKVVKKEFIKQWDNLEENRGRTIAYWITTVLVSAELALGGVWDIMQLPLVTEVITRLGYPPYFLTIIGIWKVLGAVALLIPRFPRLKEWAYAGAIFNYTGAIASFLIMGDDIKTILYPIIQIVLVIASWALRPPSRRNPVSQCNMPGI